MKKILIIANYKGPIGGISGQVEELHKNLNCEGLQRGERKVERGKYRAVIFSTQGSVVKRLWKFVQLISVARKYDVLHIHGCSERGMLPIVYGVIAGKIWGKKIIVTYHGGDADKYFAKHEAFVRRWLKRADKVIVLNGYLEKVFAKYEIPCIVIPNVVTLREDIYQQKKEIAPKLISVRHLTELYRVDLILRAYERILIRYPKATLDILGRGEMRDELEEWVKDKVKRGTLKVGSVKFVGQVPNEEVYEHLKANDILLSAPRIDNMPVSLLEAMNAGLLVISSNVGGVPYMIEQGRTGLLFESGDVDALADQIEWAIDHQEESLQMIENAKKEVKKYSWNSVREQLLPLYE